MRYYDNFEEAFNEVRRDLNELGRTVHPETMQNKYVGDDDNYITKELDNYGYKVLNPDWREVPGVHQEWIEAEWADRVQGDLNPGHAWKTRPEIWQEFLVGTGPRDVIRGRFDYTYSERMGGKHIQKVIEELRIHPNSRQLWIDMWRPVDEDRRGERRVPCTLGYWVVQRDGKIHLTYMMRSCDLVTHFPNDVCQATMLQEHIAIQSGYEVGSFVHFIGSLHVYAKDVKDAF